MIPAIFPDALSHATAAALSNDHYRCIVSAIDASSAI
jgi:hypothetical protein